VTWCPRARSRCREIPEAASETSLPRRTSQPVIAQRADRTARQLQRPSPPGLSRLWNGLCDLPPYMLANGRGASRDGPRGTSARAARRAGDSSSRTIARSSTSFWSPHSFAIGAGGFRATSSSRAGFFYRQHPGVAVNFLVAGMSCPPGRIRELSKGPLNRSCMERLQSRSCRALEGCSACTRRARATAANVPFSLLLPPQAGVGTVILEARSARVIPVFLYGLGNGRARELGYNLASPNSTPIHVSFARDRLFGPANRHGRRTQKLATTGAWRRSPRSPKGGARPSPARAANGKEQKNSPGRRGGGEKIQIKSLPSSPPRLPASC